MTIPITRAESARLYGLDWLRALADIAGAVSACWYSLHEPARCQGFPGPCITMKAALRSNVFCWGVDSFIMPLFFIMSGFLAAQLLAAKGARSFLRHRLLRIGGPILFGFVFILPLDLYAWLIGMVARGDVPIGKLKSLKLAGTPGEDLWGHGALVVFANTC